MINEKLASCLSSEIIKKAMIYPVINEIRMRKNSPLCFTVENKNIVTDHIVSDVEIQAAVNSFCKNSLHTYFDNIKKGFIPFENGYRIGVCGRAVVEDNVIKNVSEITSLNIRLPIQKTFIPYDLLKNIGIENGLLIYSPPGFGKTSLLKGIISFYSSPPYNKRITVIDTRDELVFDGQDQILGIDVFRGYPMALAIDIAVRTMSPEIIVCDEIGLSDDAKALIECKSCGVNLVCTAHARSIKELLNRQNIKALHDMNVFGGYLQILLKNKQRAYEFTKREDIIS